jgi:hypothetical protein
MKMGCGVVIGLFLLAAGASIILNSVFKLDLPVFRSAVALLLIYAGFGLLLGGFGVHLPAFGGSGERVVFTDAELGPQAGNDGEREMSVVFGKGRIRLRDFQVSDEVTELRLNVVFGEGVVEIDPEVPVMVEASGAFGSTRMPDGNSVTFGTLTWRSPAFRPDAPHIRLRTSTLFGSTVFRLPRRGPLEPQGQDEGPPEAPPPPEGEVLE